MQPRGTCSNHELSFSFQKDQRINSELLKRAVSSGGTSELAQQWHAVVLVFTCSAESLENRPVSGEQSGLSEAGELPKLLGDGEGWW